MTNPGVRPMTSKILLIVAATVVSSCVWTGSVKELSKDTFEVSSSASSSRGGEEGAKESAAKQAAEHCESFRKKSEIVDTVIGQRWPSNTVATVTFKCT